MLLEINNVGKQIAGKWLYRNLSFSCDKGECLIISGLSGAGKTTLLNSLALLEQNDEGRIKLMTKQIGYAFQHDHIIPWVSVLENIEIVIPVKQKSQIREQIAQWLTLTKLSDKENVLANRLSGGEQKRLNIIRSFILAPDLIILDEPFAFQDTDFRAALNSKIKNYLETRQGAVVITSHEENTWAFPIKRIIELGQ
ncbi:MAG: ATP-binding cassette domain-containing protein [Deltaproteobacteria bacterium]|nr:ATP-binding cassette domain-containing protein [Deltaproteobacteria bacterium]